MNNQHLTPLQVDVAQVFFDLESSSDYLVAGGAGLLASELIARHTEDLDLFASTLTDDEIRWRQPRPGRP